MARQLASAGRRVRVRVRVGVRVRVRVREDAYESTLTLALTCWPKAWRLMNRHLGSRDRIASVPLP